MANSMSVVGDSLGCEAIEQDFRDLGQVELASLHAMSGMRRVDPERTIGMMTRVNDLAQGSKVAMEGHGAISCRHYGFLRDLGDEFAIEIDAAPHAARAHDGFTVHLQTEESSLALTRLCFVAAREPRLVRHHGFDRGVCWNTYEAEQRTKLVRTVGELPADAFVAQIGLLAERGGEYESRPVVRRQA